MAAARIRDLALEVLDRQLLDRDGMMAGNVDDVEIELPEGWPDSASGDLPVVTALLSGPGVLADRFGGTVGHGWAALHRRLHPGDAESIAIPLSEVRDFGSDIKLGIAREDVASHRFEHWFRANIVEKIPGAFHAPE